MLERSSGAPNLANSTEKDKHTKIEVPWPVFMLDEEGTEGEIRNISATGMFIRCAKPLRINQLYRFSLRPPGHHPIELNGTVMWSNLDDVDGGETADGIGLYFVEISDEDRHFLSDIISAYQGQRRETSPRTFQVISFHHETLPVEWT